jgi:hypothetical protein
MFGATKTVSMVSKFAKQAAKTAANAVISAANKGVLSSAKGASKKEVNVNARKAARRVLKKINKV